MSASNLKFEEVPVEVARKVAQREKMISVSRESECSICGKAVKLEQCKVDENGNPVHDHCYVRKVRAGR